MNRLLKQASMLVLSVAALAVSPAGAAVLDDFNRADAGTLGSGWTQVAGTSSISGNQATGTNGSLATFNGGSGNTVSFDIANVGSDTQYIAAVLGYGGGNNLFIKVQNNGGSSGFTHYAFYTGNNGGGLFNGLSTPGFTQAHITASFVGSLATLIIDPLGGTQQVYNYDYGFTPTGTGTGIGLGFYGSALADNFGGDGRRAVPEPATWAMMIVGLAAVGASMRRRQKVAVSFA